MKLPKIITKQYQLGQAPGAVLSMYTSSSVYQSLINTVMLSITTYVTSLSVHAPSWFNIWWFLLAMLVINVVIMIGHYKFVFPSQMAFGNQQSYNHESPVKKELENIKRNMVTKKDLEDFDTELNDIHKNIE